ncbi:MAG: sugar kinase [Firmicutes bacterium]|nr:sugar kinase [Bacillota bacterium]
MKIKLREDAKYALIVPSSMGVRITPVNGQPVYNSNMFMMHATSAETNVATIASSLGLPAKVLTTFVKDSGIADFIKRDLRARNIDYEGVEREQGDPWGFRHQFNVADSGYGARGPRVLNDRAGEVGRELSIDDFDLDRIFGDEGAQILHMSGLIAALSPQTSKFCLALAEKAKQYGTVVSFDLNYRESFWKGRKEELAAAFDKIASVADVLIGNEEDYQLCLGVKGPEAGGKDLAAQINSFKGMINNVKAKYPNIKFFGTTLRQVISVNEHLWGSIILNGDEWNVIEPSEIHVLDRIGGGDGFVGGLLYSILKGFETEKCNRFAWATGAMATTFLTDYATVADEEQVWSIAKGNARVKR